MLEALLSGRKFSFESLVWQGSPIRLTATAWASLCVDPWIDYGSEIHRFQNWSNKAHFPLSLQLPLNWTMNSNYTIKPTRNLWVIRVCLGQWVLMEEPANNYWATFTLHQVIKSSWNSYQSLWKIASVVIPCRAVLRGLRNLTLHRRLLISLVCVEGRGNGRNRNMGAIIAWEFRILSFVMLHK